MAARTTIRMDEGLLADAKRLGRDTGRTLTAVIEEAVREAVRRGTARPRKPKPLPPLPVSKYSSGLRPGVNLDSWVELLDFMEANGDPPGR